MYSYNLDFYQIMMTACIFIVSYFITLLVGVKKKSDIVVVSLIFLWHTLFSVVYYLFSLTTNSDAKGYYKVSLELDDNSWNIQPGTNFLNYFTSIFTQNIETNYFNTTLIFGSFGTIGLVLLFLSLKKYLENLSKYWILLIFIPSMSFWSASLSKDSISFLSVGLFLFSITTSQKVKFLPLMLSFFIMFFVRPHVFGVMLASYTIYFLFVSKIHTILKIIVIPFLFTGLIVAIRFVEKYIGKGDQSYSNYIENREVVSQVGGSAVDLTSMSFPMKLFTYLFRPLPYEAHSITALITSLENVGLIFLLIYILIKNKITFKYLYENKNFWLSVYVLMLWTVFALTTANLGIATRQKWMFVPVLLYLIVYARNRNVFTKH